MDDEDISNLPIFLTILNNQVNHGSILLSIYVIQCSLS